jgi:hypothetical protein
MPAPHLTLSFSTVQHNHHHQPCLTTIRPTWDLSILGSRKQLSSAIGVQYRLGAFPLPPFLEAVAISLSEQVNFHDAGPGNAYLGRSTLLFDAIVNEAG